MFKFQDNTGLLYSKWSSQKKTTLLCEGIFQIQPPGMELWDKTLNFEDSMELWDKTLNFEDSMHGLKGYQYSENSGQKLQPKYWCGAVSISGVDFPPHNQQRWDIEGTKAGTRVDPKLR